MAKGDAKSSSRVPAAEVHAYGTSVVPSTDPEASTLSTIRSEKPADGRLPPVVVYHDIFNLVFLGWLNASNIYYIATGQGFHIFYFSTMLYFIVDLIYVAVVPRSVKSPMVILVHHVVAALYVVIPYYYPKYGWAMSYNMLVEVNTWLLIAKRTVRSPVVEALFYLTWVLLRNIFCPYLTWRCYYEWQEETRAHGTPWNMILVAPFLQLGLSCLNAHWTWNLFMKPSKSKQL